MGKKLYVGNLPFSATEDSLKEAFSQFGTVESITIIMDRDTGRPKGFGFLEMSSQKEAADVVAKMNGAEMDGRALRVNEALAKSPRDGGGGGRGNYGGGYGR